MRVVTSTLVGAFTLALCCFASEPGSLSNRWFPPLPAFREVTMRTQRNSTTVTITYGAPERPKVQWFIGGVPVAMTSRGYYSLNVFELGGYLYMSTIQMDKAISVCLHNTVGSTCLYLRPQPQGMADKQEDLEFPWPLVVPAPTVRYDAGRKTRLFVPVLSTQHDYNYTGLLLGHSPSRPSPPLVRASSRDMQGGHAGDLVTISPVTSGSQGWLVEVATDTSSDLEGMLLLKTHFVPESELVDSCTTTRPISFYRRQNSAPFPQGFVATVPRDDPALPWRCWEGAFCMITCPFVSNGDVTMSISRKRNGSSLTEELPTASVFAEEWRSGGYYAEARFLLEDKFQSSRDSGLYKCVISTATGTAFLEANLVAG